MKTPCQKRCRPEQGYFLAATLIFALLVGIALGSYLLLAGQEEKMVVSSERWNAALAVAEAGVDEALAQMNASPGDFTANGWGGGSPNYGPVTRTLTDGSYTVIISNDSFHTIYSTGYESVPASSRQLSRTVKVTAQDEPLFSVGLGAVDNINLNGHVMYTDSYNSTNGPYGSAGSPTSSEGDVASVNGIVNIGNDTINGNVYLGPNASFQQGANGTVNGTVYYDYNVQFPNAVLPTTDTNGNTISWLPASSLNGTNVFGVSIGSTNISFLNGYYYVDNSKPIYVAPGQNVTVQVETTTFDPSSVTIDGGLTNSGTLTMYQDSGSVYLGGNATGGSIASRPENFYYYGLPGVTSITFSGTAAFVGAIYAPEAYLTLSGGGSSENIIGSVIVYQVTDNGHWDVHYDMSLANYGPSRGFIPTSWAEIY